MAVSSENLNSWEVKGGWGGGTRGEKNVSLGGKSHSVFYSQPATLCFAAVSQTFMQFTSFFSCGVLLLVIVGEGLSLVLAL